MPQAHLPPGSVVAQAHEGTRTPAEAFSLGGCLTIHMGTPAEAFSLELINYPQKNRIGTPAEVFSLGVV